MTKLKNILNESNVQLGKVYSNPYATAFVKENEEQEEPQMELSEEQKNAFFEAVKQYKKYGESVYRNAGLEEVYESIKNMVEVANKVTLSETGDWFDNVTVGRHMKRMGESFKVFEKTLKEVGTLQQRLESSYDEIGEVLGKYYEISEELDPVGKEDGDIDNDGDEDASDEYLANRRKVISKAIKNESMKLIDMISVNEASEEFVVYVEKDNGRKKLLHTKKSQRAANMFLTKNADKILNQSGIRTIGSMSKFHWEKDEAQYAENIKKTDMKTVTKKEWDKAHKDYKGMIKGQPYMMYMDKKGATVYGPVNIVESVNEDTKKRFDVDFYKGNGDRQTSHEEIIRGDKFSDIVSQATKVAKSKGMNYVEFYYKDSFIGSIDKRNGYEFKKGRDSEKSPLSINEVASRTAMEIGGLTGMNKDAIQKFVDDNNLDIEKVYQYVKKSKLPARMDFVTAVAGKPNNPIQKKLIKMFSESVVNEAKYDIGMGRKGNGITVYNRAEEEKGDYKTIAHISDNGTVKYYDKKLPSNIKKQIEAEASKMKESVKEGTKMIKLKNLLNESFGFGELPSSKLMKMKVPAKQVLKEGTRSQVGYIDNNGNIKSTYVHFDGYPENMKPGIKKHMKSEKDVKTLIKRGGARGIFDDKDIEYYDDKSAKPMSGNLEDIEKYIKDSDFKGGAEFVYLYNTKDKKWYFADTYKDKELKKLY